MNEPSIVAKDSTYFEALGQAAYSFLCLERQIVFIIQSIDATQVLPAKPTSGQISSALEKALRSPAQRLPAPLWSSLSSLQRSFDTAKDNRNDLLHAHVLSDGEWEQEGPHLHQLHRLRHFKDREQGGAFFIIWTTSALRNAADQFERLANEAFRLNNALDDLTRS